MKHQIIRSITIIFFAFFMFNFLQAQDNIDKTYSWDDASDKITLKVEVKKDADILSMAFEGDVSKGNLVVYAYDPNGNKECGFCLITDCSLSCGSEYDKSTGIGKSQSNRSSNSTATVSTENGVKTTTTSSGQGYSYSSSSSSDNSGAKGNAMEKISDPVPGTWKFVIEAIEVTGKLKVNIDQE